MGYLLIAGVMASMSSLFNMCCFVIPPHTSHRCPSICPWPWPCPYLSGKACLCEQSLRLGVEVGESQAGVGAEERRRGACQLAVAPCREGGAWAGR